MKLNSKQISLKCPLILEINLMANLHDELIEEIERCAKLTEIYDELGAVGQFGKIMIQNDIDEAKAA
jgi:hypothetical protein